MEELRNEVNNEMETIEVGTETTDLLPVDDDYSYEVDTKVDVSSMLIGGAIVAAVGGTIAVTKFIRKKIKDRKAKKKVEVVELEDEVDEVETVEGEIVDDIEDEEDSEKKSKKK